MARINCHSAFKHYEMFHSRGGDVINIGSNNTTIFNCGGSHLGGGFWGGFGLGLGNAFGSLFSGFGGFGMGGFGFPSFGGGFGNFGGGWSNPWGNSGGSTRSANSSNNTCHCNDNTSDIKEDADQKKLKNLINQIKGFVKDKNDGKPVDPNAIAKLRQELRDRIAKPLDDIYKDNNINHYELLLKDLNEAFPEATEATTTPAATTEAATTAPTTTTPATATTTPAAEAATPATEAATPAAEAATATEETEAAANNEETENPHTYLPGYTNYDGKTELNNGDVIRAHDKSGKTRDTESVNGKPSTITKSEGSHPQIIVIHDKKDITYKFDKKNEYGEYIYVSDQDHQEYILQKHGDKYELIQYDWHEGYGKKDWSSKE